MTIPEPGSGSDGVLASIASARACPPCEGSGVRVVAYTAIGDGVLSPSEDGCARCGGTGADPPYIAGEAVWWKHPRHRSHRWRKGVVAHDESRLGVMIGTPGRPGSGGPPPVLVWPESIPTLVSRDEPEGLVRPEPGPEAA